MFVSQWFSGRILTIAVGVLVLNGCSSSSAPPPPPPPPPNQSPTADAGPDQAVSSLDAVTLDGSSSADADGTVDVYTWTQTTGTPTVTLDETIPAMPTFTAPNVGSDEILTFELQVTDNEGAMSAVDSVLITINPTLALPFSDDFTDGIADGWTEFDDAITNASAWSAASSEYVQTVSTNDFGGNLNETYRRGTYAHLTDSVNLTNYRLSVDARPRSGSSDDFGVMFRFTDNDHYYRFSLNSEAGSARLESKVGLDLAGDPIYQTLAHNFRGYKPNELHQIVVEVEGSLIQVFVNGNPLFAAHNTDHVSGGVALYGRDGVNFDNVSITTNSTDPEIVIVSPVADSVIPRGPRNVNLVAIARNVPAAGSVDLEFVGAAPCNAVVETNPGEFTAQCPNRAVGNYQVRAVLRDSGIEVDSDTNSEVAVGAVGVGDKYDAIGDSLTLGFLDNYATDNLNLADPRTVSFQGWAGPLGDMLTTANGAPNLVGNEGVPGATTADMRFERLSSILERNSIPRSNRALLMLGTNDSNDFVATPSGLGCVGAACDFTYKGHMERIIQNLMGANRDTIYVGIVAPVWGSTLDTQYDPADLLSADPNTAARNKRVIGYNQVVIDELSLLANVELGPDLFSCFLTPTVNRFSLFEDSLHPNSLGHALIAALWRDAIIGGPVIPPVDPCPSPIYILESLDPYVHGHKQNLLEVGDEYYTDESFTLTAIPSELADGVWVLQANADNANVDAGFLNFDAGVSPVTVYIAYDPAGDSPTSSTHVFTPPVVPLSGPLSVSDGSVGTFTIVEATGVMGTVSIGGNKSGASPAPQQAYVVIVVP